MDMREIDYVGESWTASLHEAALSLDADSADGLASYDGIDSSDNDAPVSQGVAVWEPGLLRVDNGMQAYDLEPGVGIGAGAGAGAGAGMQLVS